MPIDPNIVLGVRQPQISISDPIEQYRKGVALQALLGQQELQGMQLQQARQGIEDEQATRDAYAAAGGDNARLRQILQERGQYKPLQALDKFDLERREKEASIGQHTAATQKSQHDVAIDKVQRGASILSNVRDQASYESARRQIALTIDPGIASQMPEQYDPAFVKSKIDAGVTMVQKLTDQRARETAAEQARHNQVTEGNAAATLANARERLAFDKGQPKEHYDAERGIMVNERTGASRPVTAADGAPIGAKEKPLTEAQGKAAGLASRAQAAHDVLRELEDKGVTRPSLIKQGAESVPVIGGALGTLANATVASSAQQRVEQAQRDFVNAALRVESGASINESEFQNARKQYFPQPGDSKPTIEQKRRNRETEIESLKTQAGPGAKTVKTTYAGRTSGGKIRGVLTPNPDGSFNYGAAPTTAQR
jgi:hypothetical protein